MRPVICFLYLLVQFTIAGAQHSSPAASHLNKVITLSISNQPLSIVLEKISKAGNFYFSYSGNVLKSDATISINADKKSVRAVLNEIFKGSVEYKETGKYIILRSISNRFKVVPQNINTTEDTYEIDGYVFDESSGLKVSNASVYERKLVKSTLTDKEGYFKLNFKEKIEGVILTVSKEDFRDTSILFLASVTVKAQGQENSTDGFGAAHNIVEKLGLSRFLIASRQRIQSLNIPAVLANTPFQASVWPGLSSQGIMSSQVVNKGSLNILGGYTAGVDGVEVGGLFNINKKDVKNVQVAGFMNIVGGAVKGVQAAGLFNTVLDSVKGVQAAGLFNRVRNTVDGVQAAGLLNLAKSDVTGGQYAGLINVSGGDLDGMQGAGLINMSLDTLRGWQASGLLSINGGLTNGVQVSGLVSTAAKSIKGTQISGLGNISGGTLKGVQVSGLFNFAKRMDGTQIGIVNIADTSSGYSIGLLNLVRKGYHKISASVNEIQHAEIRFKTGNAKLYTMLIAGISLNDHPKVFSAGAGMGHDFLISKRLSVAADLSAQWLQIDRQNSANFLYRCRLLGEYRFNKWLTAFIGPSYAIFQASSTMHTGIGPTRQAVISEQTRGWWGWNAGITLF